MVFYDDYYTTDTRCYLNYTPIAFTKQILAICYVELLVGRHVQYIVFHLLFFALGLFASGLVYCWQCELVG